MASVTNLHMKMNVTAKVLKCTVYFCKNPCHYRIIIENLWELLSVLPLMLPRYFHTLICKTSFLSGILAIKKALLYFEID